MMWKIVLPFLAAVFAIESASMVGGWRDLDTNDAEVQSIMNFAVDQHNRQSNNKFLTQVAQVFKAESQVVSGMKYRFTVKMGKTSCEKKGASEACAIHADADKAQYYNCTLTVWSQPWLHRMVLQNPNTC